MVTITVNKRKTIHSKLAPFCILSKERDYIEVTEWTNGEGYDIQFEDKNISLTHGEIDAIDFIIKIMKYGDVDVEYNDEDNFDDE